MTKVLYRFFISFFCTVFNATQSYSQHVKYDPGAILHEIKRLNTFCNVLYIAAHPDDENTRLLSYLANERCCRTAYLSLTRGDGGQNLIGREQSDELGIIRTQELLAARKIDGAEQLFTRAVDFGYSKNPEETFQLWGRQQVLEDVVFAIRNFKPDIIITRFPEDGSGGHGHHTASAMLAREAYKAAADPKIFPAQLKFTQPWQTKALFWNTFAWNRLKESDKENLIKLDIGQFNNLLGKSYGEIAATSRSQHRSQGFGVANTRGEMIEYFQQWEGKTANEILEGIPNGWERLAGSEKAASLAAKLAQRFNPEKPNAISKDLVLIYKLLDELPESYFKQQKMTQVKQLLLMVNGIHLNLYTTKPVLLRNEQVELMLSAINRSNSNISLHKVNVNFENESREMDILLPQNQLKETKLKVGIPSSMAYTSHDWLREERTGNLFRIADYTKINYPDNEHQIYSEITLLIDGTELNYTIPATYKWVDPVRGELERRPEIIPEIIANGVPELLLIKNNDADKAKIKLSVYANADNVKYKLIPRIETGWKVSPAEAIIEIAENKTLQQLAFEITAPAGKNAVSAHLTFDLQNDNRTDIEPLCRVRRIDYEHIPMQTTVAPVNIRVVKADIQTTAGTIGYIEGAGDEIPKALELLGYQVRMIDKKNIQASTLNDCKAVITGVRAYNTNEEMNMIQPFLEKYVEDGGRVIIQYNTLNWISELKAKPIPYLLNVSKERVTNEKAPVKFLLPEHFLLRNPHNITSADFDHWVQERGLYFPDKWGDEVQALLSMNDPGEESKNGALLCAAYGRGYFIYTGLSFFRQLPAGVPGAFRLFINLIEGKN
ncbi:MAG: PIG-L family deacetylase [Flavobacteriales bacterium]